MLFLKIGATRFNNLGSLLIISKMLRKNWLFIASIIIVLIATMMPVNGKMAGNYLDKLAHFLIFLNLSINICYRFQQPKNLIPMLMWGILFGLMTEVIQQFVPGRNMDMLDGIADTLGMISGYYLYQKYKSAIDKTITIIT